MYGLHAARSINSFILTRSTYVYSVWMVMLCVCVWITQCATTHYTNKMNKNEMVESCNHYRQWVVRFPLRCLSFDGNSNRNEHNNSLTALNSYLLRAEKFHSNQFHFISLFLATKIAIETWEMWQNIEMIFKSLSMFLLRYRKLQIRLFDNDSVPKQDNTLVVAVKNGKQLKKIPWNAVNSCAEACFACAWVFQPSSFVVCCLLPLHIVNCVRWSRAKALHRTSLFHRIVECGQINAGKQQPTMHTIHTTHFHIIEYIELASTHNNDACTIYAYGKCKRILWMCFVLCAVPT